MAAQARKHIIVQRQTLDWAGRDYSNEAAAEAYMSAVALAARKTSGLTPEQESRITRRTKTLLDLWDSTFTISFAHCRYRLKQIAHATWAQVQDCDRIYFDWTDPEILQPEDEADRIILFTDDDDWFAPDIFRRLEARPLDRQNSWLWNRSRYDGTLLVSALGDPIYAFTNNYAILGRVLEEVPTLGEVMQHGMAERWIRSGRLKVAMMEGAFLSVTNKSPCSLTTLQRAAQSGTPRATLIELIERYAAVRPAVLPDLDWARPFMVQTCGLFREVRNSLRG